jgi:hypothetical protein
MAGPGRSAAGPPPPHRTNPVDGRPMPGRHDDLDTPMRRAVGRVRHRDRGRVVPTDLHRQEHRFTLDRGDRREPGILEPLEDQVGVRRVPPRHLRHRHPGRSCLPADRALLLGVPAAVPAPARPRSGRRGVHPSQWTPLPTSPAMIDVQARSARRAHQTLTARPVLGQVDDPRHQRRCPRAHARLPVPKARETDASSAGCRRADDPARVLETAPKYPPRGRAPGGCGGAAPAAAAPLQPSPAGGRMDSHGRRGRARAVRAAGSTARCRRTSRHGGEAAAGYRAGCLHNYDGRRNRERGPTPYPYAAGRNGVHLGVGQHDRLLREGRRGQGAERQG